jgi:hypothetical protein
MIKDPNKQPELLHGFLGGGDGWLVSSKQLHCHSQLNEAVTITSMPNFLADIIMC